MRDGNFVPKGKLALRVEARDLPMRDGNVELSGMGRPWRGGPRPSYEGWKHGLVLCYGRHNLARDLPMRDGNTAISRNIQTFSNARDLPMRDGN